MSAKDSEMKANSSWKNTDQDLSCRICGHKFEKSMRSDLIDKHISNCANTLELRSKFDTIDTELRGVC